MVGTPAARKGVVVLAVCLGGPAKWPWRPGRCWFGDPGIAVGPAHDSGLAGRGNVGERVDAGWAELAHHVLASAFCVRVWRRAGRRWAVKTGPARGGPGCHRGEGFRRWSAVRLPRCGWSALRCRSRRECAAARVRWVWWPRSATRWFAMVSARVPSRYLGSRATELGFPVPIVSAVVRASQA